MKHWSWLIAVLSLVACSREHLPVQQEVQEGHGGDSIAAFFVDVARAAAVQGRYSIIAAKLDGPLTRLERIIEATPIHSTEEIESFGGTPLVVDGTTYGKLTRAPRANQPVLMLDRKLLRKLIGSDDREAQRKLAGPALRVYLTLDPEDAHLAAFQNFELPTRPGSLAVPGESWPEIADQVLAKMLETNLVACTNFDWFRKLVAEVPVEATDAKLLDARTGFEVDAITQTPGDGHYHILYNRSRMASVPRGTPRSLLVVHEYLRSEEDNRMERDEFYTLSSLLAQQAAWPLPWTRAAVTGAGEYAGTTVNNLCRELHNHFGLPLN